MQSNIAIASRLAIRFDHAASLGIDLWSLGQPGDRTQSRHHGRQVAPRRRDTARRQARAFKLAQHITEEAV
jgi:hypothetical protein